MTPLHRDLTALGFADLLTTDGKTSGLRWIEGGVGMYSGLRIERGRAAWDTSNEYTGRDAVEDARRALRFWRAQVAITVMADCG